MAGSQDPDSYSAVLAVRDLPELRDAVYNMATILDLDGQVALASRARAAFIAFVRELELIAKQTATAAQDLILEEEAKSRVRPDTGGGGGDRLENHLGFSAPLNALPGSVGVNYEPELYEHVPWWWTNEEGYSGFVGRVVHGFFYDAGWTGGTRPDTSRSREHPLFRAVGPQGDQEHRITDAQSAADYEHPEGARGPGMLIQNPIPARRFVERGYAKASAQWHTRVRAARAAFDRESDLILNAMLRPRTP
jgi:hypothetical protein